MSFSHLGLAAVPLLEQWLVVQELLQHALLDRKQLLDSEAEALCQPLLSRIVPACLQSRSTLAEDSAAMVVSQMLVLCAQYAGAVMMRLPGLMHVLLVAALLSTVELSVLSCLQSTQQHSGCSTQWAQPL
jgi:hypothetical protein